jgi:hypothetical protein
VYTGLRHGHYLAKGLTAAQRACTAISAAIAEQHCPDDQNRLAALL